MQSSLPPAIQRWENPDTIAKYQSTLMEMRPYFGAVCQADQGSSHFWMFSSVVNVVRRTNNGLLKILEIGSWAGASLVAWDSASDGMALLTAVDMWEPYLNENNSYADMMTRVAASGQIKYLFGHNMQVCGLEPRLTILDKRSNEVLPGLSPGFDIIYIDGDHRYSFVHEDIRNSMKLVRDGGILCGDDLDVQLKYLDLIEHREVLDQNKDAGVSRSGVSYHAGVTQAVHDFFGTISSHYGGRFWVVQKVGDSWRSVTL